MTKVNPFRGNGSTCGKLFSVQATINLPLSAINIIGEMPDYLSPDR